MNLDEGKGSPQILDGPARALYPAAQIPRLREEDEAATLFQLGWQMRGDGVRDGR